MLPEGKKKVASLWVQKGERNDWSNESLMERISIQDAYVSKYSTLQFTGSNKHVQQILYVDLIRLYNDVTLGLAFNINKNLPHNILVYNSN
jgi:hypothetical protein